MNFKNIKRPAVIAGFFACAMAFGITYHAITNPAPPLIRNIGSPFLPGTMETTPIEFNHRVLIVASNRPNDTITEGRSVSIYEYGTLKLVGKAKIGNLGLISAIVVNNKVYIFGSTNWSTKNTVEMISSADLTHWSPPVTVFRSNQIIYNTSVAPAPGGFVMAYEVASKSGGSFYPKFAKSPDLTHWSDIPGSFDGSRYAACPTIRYANGNYYVMYLAAVDGKFETTAARSADLAKWEYDAKPLFTPKKKAGDGIDASDVDLVQSAGKTYFVYAIGNQSTWTKLRRAEYSGPISDFFESIYYSRKRTI